MSDLVYKPLKPPTPLARKVFQKALERNPDIDMRAVPNQWLIDERALCAKVTGDLEAEVNRLRAALEAAPPRNLNLEGVSVFDYIDWYEGPREEALGDE